MPQRARINRELEIAREVKLHVFQQRLPPELLLPAILAIGSVQPYFIQQNTPARQQAVTSGESWCH
jgi:hypothetical protein